MSFALVVGHGRMGRFHRKVLQDLGYDVVTVDPVAEADFASTDAALLNVVPSVAAVACPPDQLEPEALKLAGVPMLVEKPFALDRTSAMRLARALADTPCCVGFIERFNPQVRTLRRQLAGRTVERARFTRQSERPSPDPLLDLAIHDIDLAHHLGIPLARASFEPSYGGRLRTVEIHHDAGDETVDLRDHEPSPLHALWHAFLIGAQHPTPLDAVRAHEGVESLRQTERTAA